MSEIGHNSNGVAAEHLRTFIERIERLEDEKDELSSDISDIYKEAKGNGFNTKIIRQVIKIRKKSADERAEEEALLGLYMHALGMLADTPLGQAAIEREFGASP